MPTSITVSLRCQTKNLIIAADGDSLVSVSLQSVNDPNAPQQTSSMNTTIPVAEDTFVMGNMYDCNVADGVAKANPAKPTAPTGPRLPGQ